MPSLKRSDVRIFDDAFQMHSGYVLDFSDRTFAEFFEEEFGIEIYQEAFRHHGPSKAKHLRCFIEVSEPHLVAHVARRLWQHRESLRNFEVTPETEGQKARLFELLARLEGMDGIAQTDAIERFKRDETLEELIAAIERDIRARKPAAALDRLHTYCMKKFGHLLTERGVTWDRSDPLQSRVGKYVKILEQGQDLREISRRVIKSAISVFEAFNDIRNNRSFAHDNDIVDQAEARFIFDAVSAFLRFIKTVESRFER